MFAWKQHEAVWAQVRKSDGTPAHHREQIIVADGWKNAAMRAARTVSKRKATTAAGIYAKALLVRFSAGSAAVMAMSLAEDFLDCEGLRSSLWPAAREG